MCILFLNRRPHRDLWITNPAMTYDHLEIIINILKEAGRFPLVMMFASKCGNTNIKKSEDRFQQLQEAYKPGFLNCI